MARAFLWGPGAGFARAGPTHASVEATGLSSGQSSWRSLFLPRRMCFGGGEVTPQPQPHEHGHVRVTTLQRIYLRHLGDAALGNFPPAAMIWGLNLTPAVALLYHNRLLFPSRIQSFPRVSLPAARSKSKAAGAEEPRAAPGAPLLPQQLLWGCWCNLAIAKWDHATWLGLVPCCPVSRQRQETKGRRSGSRITAPLTDTHKICESGEEGRVSDTCQQGIKCGKSPRG